MTRREQSADVKPALWKTRAPLIALAALLFLIAIEAARLGIAGLIVELAQAELTWQPSSPSPQSRKDVERTARLLAESIEFGAGNPWALEGLGTVELARMRLSPAPGDALRYARGAYDRFREALRQRPTSPFLWSSVALSKLYLDEIDAEFLAALRNADELGPWEPTTQQAVLFAGLAAWQKLGPDLEQPMVRVLERGAKRNALKMFEIVKGFRRLDLVCALKGYDVVAGPECRKLAASSASTKGKVDR